MAARIRFQAFVWLQYIVYAARLSTHLLVSQSVCLPIFPLPNMK